MKGQRGVRRALCVVRWLVRSAEIGVRWLSGFATGRPADRLTAITLMLLTTSVAIPSEAQRPGFRPNPPPQVDDEVFGQFNVPYDVRWHQLSVGP